MQRAGSNSINSSFQKRKQLKRNNTIQGSDLKTKEQDPVTLQIYTKTLKIMDKTKVEKEILLEQINVRSENNQKAHFRDNAYDISLLKFKD